MRITRNPSPFRERAFTMVEIALSLAIIAFAFVAILGVLPTGLKVQRENREETIINQDAQVWLSAIRSGARGYDQLTNYVDAITNNWTEFNRDGTVGRRGRDAYWTDSDVTKAGSDIESITPPPFLPPTNGFRIIGLLSTPRYTYHDVASRTIQYSNYVTAYVRAISGAATEKYPQTNASVRELSFSYRIVCEVVPYAGWDTNWAAFAAPGLSPDEVTVRSNYWMVARNTYQNTTDLRLLFRWPLLPRGGTGEGRQAFRATVGGDLESVNDRGMTLHFFNPRTYVRYQ